MESNTAPLLEMRGIKKDFFGNQVLTDINFTLKAGYLEGKPIFYKRKSTQQSR